VVAKQQISRENGFQNMASAFFKYFPNEVLAVGLNTGEAGYQMFVRG
jgi:hypothetical protein